MREWVWVWVRVRVRGGCEELTSDECDEASCGPCVWLAHAACEAVCGRGAETHACVHVYVCGVLVHTRIRGSRGPDLRQGQ